MKRTHIRTLFFTLALTLGLAVLPVSAAGDSLTGLTYRADPAQENTAVSIQTQSGARYLFLPANADLSALTLWFNGGDAKASANGKSVTVASGQPFDLASLYAAAPADGVYRVTLTRGRESVTLGVMVSDAIGSVYLTSADPGQDRQWVEQDKDNHKAKGQMVYLRPDGSTVYAGDLKQIKGRGNSTWDYPKKPYQIKLADKCDLLGAGEEPESTWVLLANYCDETLIHNSITYDLAQALGMAYTPHCEPVDLYYDGEYRGSYLLCEKTEVGDGRVAIDDLEGEIEKANPHVEDMDRLSTATAVNASGNTYQYVAGLTVPKDYSGGYLLEMDFEVRAKAEKSWFTTSAGSYVVVKSPEYMPQAAMSYISALYQAFEDAVMNGGVHPDTGKDYREYVDLDSLAQCFLLLELSQCGDAFQSSTYFYKPAGEEKLYAGPLWDFDSAYGSYDANFPVNATVAGRTTLGRALLKLPSFRDAVKAAYWELKPLVEGTLLSADPAAQTGALGSLGRYAQELAASQRMDHLLWPATTPNGYDNAITGLRNFLIERHNWYYNQVINWTGEPDILDAFVDVPAEAWYAGAVAYVLDNGLMNGVSQLRFHPNGTMTRAMAVTVLHRLAGEPPAETAANFPDVDPTLWYGPAVAWAAEKGVAQGFDGRFRPDDPITRQELVTILHRYGKTITPDLTAPEISGSYIDVGLVPAWAKEAFGWAIAAGVLTGNDDGTLNPQGLALRCQGAAMIQRFHETLNP